MESNHEFTVQLTGDGSYVIKLLEGVQIERRDGVVVGHWPAFSLDAKGANEDEIYQQLLGGLREQLGAGPGSSEFEPFAAYVREHGRRLSEDEAAARELAQLREMSIRWALTDDEQYMIRLFADAEVHRAGDTVAVRAFGLEGSGQRLGQALQNLNTAINEACGVPDAPGPRFEEITSWVRSNGEPVPADVRAQEAKDKQAYLVARDQLAPITPEDIPAESSTGVPLLVDFWAEWCGPCRMVTPVLAALAEQWAGRIVVRKIDVDQFDGIWERFNFRGIPAMIMFKDGKEIHRVIGFGGKAKLVAELEPHLA
ncbi:thioredoxin [Mycobacterium sp. OAS707]|uniref:thioredoxin domain-containing protein n=1 Tax=Mycobacterium sp. OAS707 TaxID=2663822 RepID=UPI0019F0CF53|nr:thioredoxin domain-containing protein [Mycobacterium sp. OAS707]MBE1548527.1 thioredoxin [Mycobacterium sp. OAS707]